MHHVDTHFQRHSLINKNNKKGVEYQITTVLKVENLTAIVVVVDIFIMELELSQLDRAVCLTNVWLFLKTRIIKSKYT